MVLKNIFFIEVYIDMLGYEFYFLVFFYVFVFVMLVFGYFWGIKIVSSVNKLIIVI